MRQDFFLYIVLGMIGYDLLIHLIYFFGVEQFFLKRKINFWPEWSGLKYQTFWTLFWGIAFLSLLIYMLG
ncbi:MAG: hypothetical protein G01um101456_144 [Parcubacteria group bacterium Gr01-1014_56]|nr:MAG: hypothetical protein G01um101456_144 [Parcubacteria group bacterium Gr01-1014_56]